MSDEETGEDVLPEHRLEEAEGFEAFDWGEVESESEQGPQPDVLRFQLGAMAFAVDAGYVVEVSGPLQTTPVPGLPDYVTGVAVRRRHVLTVVDVARFLRLETETSRKHRRLLVLQADGVEAGLLVDDVTGLELWPDDSESAKLLENVSPRIRPYALGARWAPGGVIVLLDAADLVRSAPVR